MDVSKYYVTYNDVHTTVRRLSRDIVRSGFEPDMMVAIGTGGFIPARILKTFIERPILTVGIAYYDIHNRPTASPQKIQWIDEVERKLSNKKILLVDEVDDTRVTLEYTLTELLRHGPSEIAVAVMHNKRKEKRGSFPPAVTRYFCGKHLEDHWIIYPWDADDIEEHDRRAAGNDQGS